MKTILKTAIVGTGLVTMLTLDVPPETLPLRVQLVPQAQAILGVRRRAFRRGVIVGSSLEAADASGAWTAPYQAAAAPPPPVATDKPLPLGTVVRTLPAGCTSTPVHGVDYYYCGGNFYRAVFQGNNLVYVTAQP